MLDTSLDSFNFYFLVAVFQGLVLAGIILLKRPFRKPNLFLGLLVLLFSSSLLHLVLEESIHAFNSKFPIPMEFSLAFGPMAFLHVQSLKNPKAKFETKNLLHFLPSFLIDGVLFTVLFIYIRHNLDWAYGHIEEIQTGALLIAFIGLIQLSIYSILIHREAKNTRPFLKESAKMTLWLKTIVIAWSLLIGFLIIAVPVALLNIEKVDDQSYLIYKPLGTIIALWIYGLGYLYVLRFMGPLNSYVERIERLKFSRHELAEKKDQLLTALEGQQLYKDQHLSVALLAKELSWPINNVSSLISEALHTNFNDLINRYRVAAFKQLIGIPENSKYSIQGLAQEVGFTSKASFYRAFKKEMGVTPTDYMRKKGLK